MEKAKQYEEVDFTDIFVLENYNPRYDFDGQDDLMNSIKENGILQPLTVYADPSMKGKYILLNGERRMRAVHAAVDTGWKAKKIPIIVVPKPKDKAESLIISLISNDGKPLLPIEEAKAFNQLLESGMNTATIAKKIGKGEGHVKSRLLLLQGIPEVQEALKKGTIGLSVATEIVRKSKGNKEEQEALLRQAKVDPDKTKEALGLAPKGTGKLKDKMKKMKEEKDAAKEATKEAKEAAKKAKELAQEEKEKAKDLKEKLKEAEAKKKLPEIDQALAGNVKPAIKKIVALFESILAPDGSPLSKGVMKQFVEEMLEKPVVTHMHFTDLCVFWVREKYGEEGGKIKWNEKK